MNSSAINIFRKACQFPVCRASHVSINWRDAVTIIPTAASHCMRSLTTIIKVGIAQITYTLAIRINLHIHIWDTISNRLYPYVPSTDATFLRKNLNDPITASGSIPKNNLNYKHDIDVLLDQLTKLLNSKPKRFAHDVGDENTDPSAQPLFWISKWVDYSDKYGFGYQLCDEGMGVMYNDTTKLIMLSNGMWVYAQRGSIKLVICPSIHWWLFLFRYSNVHFIDREGSEKYMTVEDYPKDMEKKMKLLSYFKRYMTEHLVRAGGNVSGALGDQLSRIPHMHTWFRTTVAVVMHLTNGTVQVILSLFSIIDQQNRTHTTTDTQFPFFIIDRWTLLIIWKLSSVRVWQLSRSSITTSSSERSNSRRLANTDAPTTYIPNLDMHTKNWRCY